MTENISILICESDASLRSVMTDYLRDKGFQVLAAFSAKDALEKIGQTSVNLCIIESEMPEMSGSELVEELRHRNYTMPLILLSELSSRENILAGYRAGADDYVLKPFVMDILVCKMQALIRLSTLGTDFEVQEFDLDGVHFDAVRQQLGDKHLSSRENDILLILCRNLNQPVERSSILKSIWKNDDYFSARSLAVYIHHLRHYLESNSRMRILSVHGKGYKLVNSAK